MATPLTTSILEQRLLDREIKRLAVQVSAALKTLDDALKPYFNEVSAPFGGPQIRGIKSDDKLPNDEVMKFILSLADMTHYPTRVVYIPPSLADYKIPDFMKRAMLEKAIRDHIAAVESVEEVAARVDDVERNQHS